MRPRTHYGSEAANRGAWTSIGNVRVCLPQGCQPHVPSGDELVSTAHDALDAGSGLPTRPTAKKGAVLQTTSSGIGMTLARGGFVGFILFLWEHPFDVLLLCE